MINDGRPIFKALWHALIVMFLHSATILSMEFSLPSLGATFIIGFTYPAPISISYFVFTGCFANPKTMSSGLSYSIFVNRFIQSPTVN